MQETSNKNTLFSEDRLKFIQSGYEDATALSTKAGEAGLYMYINGEDVESFHPTAMKR